jgi:hypothetical protein
MNTTGTLTARRASACPACPEPIRAGAPIRRLPDGRGRYAHAECVAQFRRDVAADDLDALTMGYGR